MPLPFREDVINYLERSMLVAMLVLCSGCAEIRLPGENTEPTKRQRWPHRTAQCHMEFEEVTDANLEITFDNRMGDQLSLTHAVFCLDGQVLLNADAGYDRNVCDVGLKIARLRVEPGRHTLALGLLYVGHDAAWGYRVKVSSSHSVVIKSGRLSRLAIEGYTKGTEQTPPEERPGIRYVDDPPIGEANPPTDEAAAMARRCSAAVRR